MSRLLDLPAWAVRVFKPDGKRLGLLRYGRLRPGACCPNDEVMTPVAGEAWVTYEESRVKDVAKRLGREFPGWMFEPETVSRPLVVSDDAVD